MSEAAEPVALLRSLEWASRDQDGTAACPACRGRKEQGHRPDCPLSAFLAAAPRRWRHKKRGTTYSEIGEAALQTTGGTLRDQDAVVVYRSDDDGALYVRALLEFTDGRFERLS